MPFTFGYFLAGFLFTTGWVGYLVFGALLAAMEFGKFYRDLNRKG